ncbi:YggU family protein [Candidatus Peregrinibacteria bacterium]|nr:YggU family protein [Candidatus Peregrinibacteria bacterium]
MLDKLKNELSSKGETTFIVKIIPKSARNEIVGELMNDTLKIKINAVPEKGKANKELVSFLANQFNVSKSCIEIVSGHTSQIKTVKIYV